MGQCFDYDITFIETYLSQKIQVLYSPSIIVATDETMTPHKGRGAVHHAFVNGKPHPNGVLSTSAGDANHIALRLKIRRRVEEDVEPLVLLLLLLF
jgi:hypothetical protein